MWAGCEISASVEQWLENHCIRFEDCIYCSLEVMRDLKRKFGLRAKLPLFSDPTTFIGILFKSSICGLTIIIIVANFLYSSYLLHQVEYRFLHVPTTHWLACTRICQNCSKIIILPLYLHVHDVCVTYTLLPFICSWYHTFHNMNTLECRTLTTSYIHAWLMCMYNVAWVTEYACSNQE